MADINLNVTAIEKLLEYAKSAVGAVAGPILANWRASKEGKARLTSAHFDADVRRIEAESRAQSLVIIAEAEAKALQSVDTTIEPARRMVEITPEDITQSVEYQGRKRLANVASVVEDAADELGDKVVSDHEPDPDWTARFFNDVQDVSSEDMQKIWARILAGEVESPGRTSLRTLDTLRNMTKSDAVMFRGVCDFVMDGKFVFYDDSVKGIEALKYSKLLHLQDCGLVNVGPNLVNQYAREDIKEFLITYQGSGLVVARDIDVRHVLNVPVVLLTTSGEELFRIAQCRFQMEYLQSFARFLQSHSCQLSYLGGAIQLRDGSIKYTNRIVIEPKSEQVDGLTP